MRPPDELPIASDNVLSTHLVTRNREWERRESDVIDAKAQDDVLDPRLRQHVALETCQARFAQGGSKWVVGASWAVMQQAIAYDALVEDPHFLLTLGLPLQPRRQHVRPTPVGIGGRSVSIGQRRAECHDR